MKIFNDDIDTLANSTVILGFFDGIHLGHRSVIASAHNFAKQNNSASILLTFENSPAEYFGRNYEYIYPREYNYKIIESLGVDYIISKDFSEIAEIEAEEYLKILAKLYSPQAIFTGYNYTFGKNRTGSSDMLNSMQTKYGYRYFCISEYSVFDETVSSTAIKKYIKTGMTEKANLFLGSYFTIKSTVIRGAQIGRTIGFPTANMMYPEGIVKLPYGVYKVKTDLNKPAILNWGIKPTLGGKPEVMEVHIPDFNGDLYGKDLEIKIIGKIRDEKKFNNLEELKMQIRKDTEKCLKQ